MGSGSPKTNRSKIKYSGVMRMKRRNFLKKTGFGIGAGLIGSQFINLSGCSGTKRNPNIILILADDLGYNELGCYGQKKIKTPNIDRLAEQGMRFTQFYSGSPVCAPSRSVLMTGKHTGHTFIRDNKEIGTWESFNGQLPLPDNSTTVAELLKSRGYTTAAIGKWGLGYPGSSGDPNKQGFDLFFGYNCQRHAHNYYPEFLWKNDSKIDLEGNTRGLTGKYYAPDLMEEEALNFISENQQQQFFLYFATTIPHLALQVPDDSLQEYIGVWDDPPYDGSRGYLPHPHPRAAYAAMVTRMDRTVGRIVARINELKLAEDTLIIFASDNGASYTGGYDREFFEGNGVLRSHKGYVYEGGIRIPMIAYWRDTIHPGQVSDHVGAFQDFLPTFMELTGGSELIPAKIDGVSLAPIFTKNGKQKEHDYLYMEFSAYGGQQMVLKGEWKGIRQNLMKQPDAPIELYNLKTDIREQNNVAADNPEIVSEIWSIMKKARIKSEEFPFPALDDQVAPENITINS
jgi:arylsulfatase A